MATALVLATLLASRPILNVRDFGPIGQGADDTRVFQAALDAAHSRGGATVKVPRGTFLVTSLNIHGRTELRGEGDRSVIRKVAGSQGASLLWFDSIRDKRHSEDRPVTDIAVRSLRLEDRVADNGYAKKNNLLLLNGVIRARVENVTFVGFRQDGIYVGIGTVGGPVVHTKDLLIQNCRFDGVNGGGRNGISILDGTGIKIRTTRFTRIAGPGKPGPIDIEPPPDRTYVVQGVTIERCTFVDNGGTNGAIGLSILQPQEKAQRPYRGFKFLNNVIRNQQTVGILAFQRYQRATGDTAPMDVTIQGNQISGTHTGIMVEGLSRAAIRNNTISNVERGITLGEGNHSLDVFGVEVSGNRVRTSDRNGIGINVARGERIDLRANQVSAPDAERSIMIGPSNKVKGVRKARNRIG